MFKKIICIILIALMVVSTVICAGAGTKVNAADSIGYQWTSGNRHEDDSDVAETRDIIYKFLINELKLNKAAACGVLGNIWAECCFDEHCEYGSYRGICQWSVKNRWSTCVEKYGTSLNAQLNFLKYELNNKYKKVYDALLDVNNTVDGVYDAESVFRLRYEGCGVQAAVRRQSCAVFYFKHLPDISEPSIEITERQKVVVQAVMQIYLNRLSETSPLLNLN